MLQVAENFIDSLEPTASPLSIITGEFELLVKRLFEPYLVVDTSFTCKNDTTTIWGLFSDNHPDRFDITVYKRVDDNWATCPKHNRRHADTNLALVEIRIDGDGITVIDLCKYLYRLEDPNCLEAAFHHVWSRADWKLEEAQSQMEWIVGHPAVFDFDDYIDIESKLDVLKRHRSLFNQRYQAINHTNA